MHNFTQRFLYDPKQIRLIENNPSLLKEAFDHNPEVCYRFFTFAHWHLLYSKGTNTSEEVRNAMYHSVKSLSDGIKCYYSLSYDDRKHYEPTLISLANSVEELVYLLGLLGNQYRTQIVTKMREVATTDAEKKKANSYRI